MTKSESSIFRPDAAPLEIAVLVLPEASILTVAATLDPLRAANRHLGREGFRWRVVTPSGRAAALTCGIELPSAGALAAAEGADVLIVIAGFRQADNAPPPLIAGLARIGPRFRAVGGIDAGPWVLARAGLLAGHRATVHWEDLEDFAAAHPEIDVVADRQVVSGTRFTAGGAAPAMDLMLALIRARLGAPLALQVAGTFIYDAPQAGRARQEAVAAAPLLRVEPRVAAAIARMEARIEEPEPVGAIAAALGLSARRLEMLFRTALGVGPGEYYRDLRLQAARRLVADTGHAMQDAALRCGFASQAAFSRAFRRRFGTSPSALRRASTPAITPAVTPAIR